MSSIKAVFTALLSHVLKVATDNILAEGAILFGVNRDGALREYTFAPSEAETLAKSLPAALRKVAGYTDRSLSVYTVQHGERVSLRVEYGAPGSFKARDKRERAKVSSVQLSDAITTES